LHPGTFSAVPAGLNLERLVLAQTLKPVPFRKVSFSAAC
jgi:hypothetical protein